MTTAPQPTFPIKLLLVEDTPSLQMLYHAVLKKAGYPAICASSGAEALAKFDEYRPGVVLLDLMLPDMDGMTIMRKMMAQQPGTRVIVITANGSIDKALDATRKGAHDFLVKPLGDMRLVGAVANALSEYRAQTGAAKALQHTPYDLPLADFMGESDAMRQLQNKISAVAKSMAPVFILGERGTGKKTIARMVHKQSGRAEKSIVSVNCAALESAALEEELFGTSSQPDTAGAIQRANGGTLLLENPQDMNPDLQARLVATLQTGSRIPTAGGAPVPVDMRLICCARAHPNTEMRAGRLSEDLYYRLFVIPLSVPPLRQRGDDITRLAQGFLSRIAKQEGKTFTSVSEDAARIMRKHQWHGNLRELINVLRHAVVLYPGPELVSAMLPEDMTNSPQTVDGAAQDNTEIVGLEAATQGLTMAEIEQRAVMAAIERHGGSIPQAARELDIAPSTIYRKRDVWTKPES
ncbi:sigma-54-dependent transcriptional regulator [Roseinatronobacter monicus]|uniref:sigma-54-dependent transcriptional regulator n=1 Tax=Roseinatronobacter monicus TaxID=393481 RepID=UPI003F2F2E70